MNAIADFPQDNHLWLIKCCDGFRLPHRSTSSASVSVLLQKLRFDDPARLTRLSPHEVQEILRDSPTDEEPLFLTPCPEVHVAILPKLYVGAVFQNQKFVGELPTNACVIKLPNAEASCEAKVFSEEIAPISGWSTHPYRVLNRFEYTYLWDRFSRSKCLICESGGIDFIIPRTVIFRTFYAFHYKLARAFTNGSWPERLKELIFEGDLNSGLKTGVDPDTGQWNIILQLNVPPKVAALLALYYFDPFARACAESIYSMARRDSGVKGLAPWHCEARIPFSTSKQPVRLGVLGFRLRPFTKAGPEALPRFLVTKITSSSFPDYVPQIGWDFFISSRKGAIEIPADGPAPFSTGTQPPKPAGEDGIISSDEDSNLEQSGTEFIEDTFSWDREPPMVRLEKPFSQKYSNTQKSTKPAILGGEEMSAGNNTASQHGLPEAQCQDLIRAPEKRFEHLLKVFIQLRDGGEISNVRILPPMDLTQLRRRNGVACWSFIDEVSRHTGIWPKNGWRLLVPGRIREDGTRSNGIPRTALVLEITYGKHTGYWIEIECKTTIYRSVFVYDLAAGWEEAIPHCLELIAINGGRHLQEAIKRG